MELLYQQGKCILEDKRLQSLQIPLRKHLDQESYLKSLRRNRWMQHIILMVKLILQDKHILACMEYNHLQLSFHKMGYMSLVDKEF
jgi:hypothetical protein